MKNLRITKLPDALNGDSIFIRFNNNGTEYALEVFMDYEKDKEDVEAIVTIHGENGYGGDLQYVLQKINERLEK